MSVSQGKSNMCLSSNYQHPATLENWQLIEKIENCKSDYKSVSRYIDELVKRSKMQDGSYVRLESVKLDYRYSIGDIVDVNQGSYLRSIDDWSYTGVIIDYGSFDKAPQYVVDNLDRNTIYPWTYHEDELRLSLNPQLD